MRLGATARENLAHNARAHARNFSAERMNALTLAIYAGISERANKFAGDGVIQVKIATRRQLRN